MRRGRTLYVRSTGRVEYFWFSGFLVFRYLICVLFFVGTPYSAAFRAHCSHDLAAQQKRRALVGPGLFVGLAATWRTSQCSMGGDLPGDTRPATCCSACVPCMQQPTHTARIGSHWLTWTCTHPVEEGGGYWVPPKTCICSGKARRRAGDLYWRRPERRGEDTTYDIYGHACCICTRASGKSVRRPYRGYVL